MPASQAVNQTTMTDDDRLAEILSRLVEICDRLPKRRVPKPPTSEASEASEEKPKRVRKPSAKELASRERQASQSTAALSDDATPSEPPPPPAAAPAKRKRASKKAEPASPSSS